MASERLPDELKGDLVSLEATEVKDSDEVKAKAKRKAESKAAKSKDTAMAKLPDSIAKQYKQKPRTDDDASGDIFDTKNYHKPIKDDAKKSAISPLTLAIIIVSVVILVAAGVFFAWWSGLLTLPV